MKHDACLSLPENPAAQNRIILPELPAESTKRRTRGRNQKGRSDQSPTWGPAPGEQPILGSRRASAPAHDLSLAPRPGVAAASSSAAVRVAARAASTGNSVSSGSALGSATPSAHALADRLAGQSTPQLAPGDDWWNRSPTRSRRHSRQQSPRPKQQLKLRRCVA